MTEHRRKIAVFLLVAFLTISLLDTMTPLSALAEGDRAIGVDFSIKSSFDADALDKTADRFLHGLQKALEGLELTGHAVFQNGQADVRGDLNLHDLSAVNFHLTGWEERLRLVTSLFGEAPVVITPANYIPFLLKLYYYFDIPLQYIGVFTDPYSYMHGIKPVLDQWLELTGGNGSRSISPEECVTKATSLMESLHSNTAFYSWRLGLLQHIGLDSLADDFIYALPEWTADAAGNLGLDIQVLDQGEQWTLGGQTVYDVQYGTEETTWSLRLPGWEGYRLEGQGIYQTTESGRQLQMDWKLMEEDALYAYFSLTGADLPDGIHAQGNGRISLAFGGEAMGQDRTIMADLTWNLRREDGKDTLDGRVSVLHPETLVPIITVDGQISWMETQESFQPLTADEIQGIDLFCMNDTTIITFYANAKWPIIRTAIPFLLELPPGFLNGVVEWMEENNILVTLMSGFGMGET